MTDCVDEPLGELVALPQRVPVRLPETVALRVRVTVAEVELEREPEGDTVEQWEAEGEPETAAVQVSAVPSVLGLPVGDVEGLPDAPREGEEASEMDPEGLEDALELDWPRAHASRNIKRMECSAIFL